MKSMDVSLQTSDGVELAGKYIPGSLPYGAVLLHMMPAEKSSYDALAEVLSKAGLHTLALDFRGHGASGGGDYLQFPDKEHQKYILDLQAAIEYMLRQFPEMKIGLVGASIGANIAFQYAAEKPVCFLVSLSGGLVYRGVNAGEYVQKLPQDLPVYFVSALDDGRVEGNAVQTETLYQACSSAEKSINIFRTGGHGTDILKNNPGFLAELGEWIKKNCPS